jgi:hypothetical protein
MKLLTKRVLIREVAQRWADQYSEPYWLKDAEKQGIGRKLAALDGNTASAADVESIIGNDSWTRIDHCDDCGAEDLQEAVEFGQYRESSQTVCMRCLRAAVRMARAASKEQA